MNLTSKSRYALKIVMDLAHHHRQPHVHRKDIAKRQGVPADYLDQIMIRLRRGGLVDSVRGRGGGYRLARSANEVSMWELFQVVEGSLEPVQCISDASTCGFNVSCVSHDAWQTIHEALQRTLQGITIADFIATEIPQHLLCPAGGVRECKAPASAAKFTKGS